MNNITVHLTKQTYTMDDGNLISGIQVSLCPMVYKFISLNKQKLDLLSEIRPDFFQWFINASDGQVLSLSESNSVPDASYSLGSIYTKSENKL